MAQPAKRWRIRDELTRRAVDHLVRGRSFNARMRPRGIKKRWIVSPLLLLGLVLLAVTSVLSARAIQRYMTFPAYINQQYLNQIQEKARIQTYQTLQRGAVPQGFDFGAFVPTATVNDFLKQLVGVKYVLGSDRGYWEGTQFELTAANLNTVDNRLEAQFSVNVTSPKFKQIVVPITVGALMWGTQVKQEGQNIAYELGFAPGKLDVGKIQFFDVTTHNVFRKLLQDGLLNEFGNQLRFPITLTPYQPIKLPLEQTIATPITDGQMVLKVFRQGGEQIVPTIFPLLPVLVKDGIWLLADRQAVAALPESNADPGVEAFNKLLSANISVPKTPQVWLGAPFVKETFMAVKNVIGANGVLTLSTLSYSGKLLYHRMYNTGFPKFEGFFMVEPTGEAARGTLEYGLGDPVFKDNQFQLPLSLKVDASLKMHFHLNPGNGGGVGTVAEAHGKGSTPDNTVLTVTPSLVDAGSQHALALTFSSGCQDVPVTLTTNPKVDWGPFSATGPPIGLRLTLRTPELSPVVVFPPMVTNAELQGKGLTFPQRFLQIHAAPSGTGLTITPAGLRFDAAVSVTGGSEPAQVETFTFSPPTLKCDWLAKSEALLGTWAIGSNNTLVVIGNGIIGGAQGFVSGVTTTVSEGAKKACRLVFSHC